MAQAATLVPNGALLTLTADERREILEYEKIVQLRDAVFAGAHPRIKIPPHLAASRNVSSPSLLAPRANSTAQLTRTTPYNHREGASPYNNNRSPNDSRSVGGGHLPISSKSEINPILLEKSDDLIRAELQLQRQRLERALREQIDQQKQTAKALVHLTEAHPNFDTRSVLSQGLALARPLPPAEVEPPAPAPVLSPASDSFDENTFYSSQHDTPEPFSPLQKQKEPGEVQTADLVSVGPRPAEGPSIKGKEREDVLSSNEELAAQLVARHMAKQLQQRSQETNSESSSSRGARAGDTPDVSSRQREDSRVSTQHADPTGSIKKFARQIIDGIHPSVSTDQLLQQTFANNPTSPLIRAHNLSPVAPQPARVSPLATARAPPLLRDSRLPDEAQPAQVAALRQPPPRISSADSSPKAGKNAERRKGNREKRKKRKSSINDNVATADSPYIKPEPQSPSPFSALPLPRPPKRQRQMGQFAAELNYDEPTGEVQERAPVRYEEAPPPRTYQRFEDEYEQEPRRAEPSYQRLERDDVDYTRVSGANYARRPHSPTIYTLPYAPEPRQIRAASHSMTERRIYEEPTYYREPIPRYSVRPDANRERSRSPIIRERRSPIPMAPPRAPVRIVVDAYGREYIDPTPAPPLRQSMAPPSRYRDAEVVYERAPMRTVSARVPVDAYEEDGVVYRRPSPPMAAPRRVITQPEYVKPEYRAYRQREYSVRPTAMGPPGEEYIQVRGPMERRQPSHFEELPREYVGRAPSMRPEPVKYEIPREYVGRLQSVRPEPPPREYATSVRPEARREVPMQSQREYSLRPGESIVRRDHAVGVENERYYDDGRRPAEVAFIERPRAREASVIVYADDVRREVYR